MYPSPCLKESFNRGKKKHEGKFYGKEWGIFMDATELKSLRDRWVKYNIDLLEKYAAQKNPHQEAMDKLRFFAVDYLIDFESELEEDPENEDGGILTLDTVFAGYMDSFLGRWYIQKIEGANEDDLNKFQDALHGFYAFLKENKLYKEGAAQHTKLMKRLENKKKYVKRLREYQEIQKEKGDEEKYLDLMREWEYEDLY